MNTITRNRPLRAFRWTQHIAASLSCVAIAGCGGGDGSATRDSQAAAPTQLLASYSMSGSSAAAISPDRYNRVVHQLYLAFYGRPPDPASLAQYASKLSATGVPPNLNAIVVDYQKKNSKVRELIDAFAASAEFKSMYSQNTAQFVTQLYRTVLGRTPDAGGAVFWTDLIDSGKLPRSVAALTLMSAAAASNSDAAVIDKKLEASGKFTTAIEELHLSSVYKDAPAITTGRTLLNNVTATTDASSLTTTVASSIALLSPPMRTGTLSSIAPDAVTDLRIQNIEAVAHTNVPFTFGQPFAPGHLAATDQLIGRLENGSTISLQTDVKATHADGSVRHAIISGVLPTLGALDTRRIDLLKGNVAGSSMANATSAVPSNFSSRIELNLDGVKYSADLADAVSAGNVIKWLSGSIVTESLHSIRFTSASGVPHPHLTARFDVRTYSQLNNQVRVDVVVENTPTFTPSPRAYTYDVDVLINGSSVYRQSALRHLNRARWHKALWSNQSGASPVHVMHNTGYLIATNAVPNYDQSIVPQESVLANFAKNLTADMLGPMKIGPLNPYMPSVGGRADIGPLPSWAVSYLLTMDLRARASMMALADGSGSWPVHFRDEKTGHPVRLDNEINKNFSTHMNLSNKGPLPVPRCANNDPTLCATPYTHDTAHQPSMAYLPYLLTGDYYYLEEVQFWASWNPTQTDPSGHGYGQGLVRWQQVRGQAWSLRTLGHAAYITPDNHFLKDYFGKMLNNNLDWYHTVYVQGNPNALGAYDGSGAGSFQIQGFAPWQDDFLTWSFGFLAELGFPKAEPILKWKARYPVGRMTAPGYCWTDGSSYYLNHRDPVSKRVYGSFAELYSANFQDNMIKDDNRKLVTHPQGLSYMDQPCGSQAQADWWTAATRYTWWKGQMTGYSTSQMGYPSNMQPALAVAATSGIPDAEAAWTTFINRGAKPDYSKGPQFAIIPRQN